MDEHLEIASWGRTYQDATRGEVVDSGRDRVTNVYSPAVEGADAGAKDGAGDDIDEEVAEDIEAVDRVLGRDALDDLKRS